jgi:hypothetical protein
MKEQREVLYFLWSLSWRKDNKGTGKSIGKMEAIQQNASGYFC